jgi:hypothetical protein
MRIGASLHTAHAFYLMRQHSTAECVRAGSTRVMLAGHTPVMPRAAVAAAPDTELSGRLDSLGRQIGYGRGLRPGRTQIVAVVLVIVGFWLVIGFGRALGQLNDATQRQQAAAAENLTLEAQLEAGRRELMLVQTDAFQSLQARAVGMGQNGELVFVLTSDAPPPEIVPLGRAAAPAANQTPLEAWLELLFGS